MCAMGCTLQSYRQWSQDSLLMGKTKFGKTPKIIFLPHTGHPLSTTSSTFLVLASELCLVPGTIRILLTDIAVQVKQGLTQALICTDTYEILGQCKKMPRKPLLTIAN